jgi:DNA processing protein
MDTLTQLANAFGDGKHDKKVPNWQAAELALTWKAKADNHHLLLKDSNDYPLLLGELANAPPVLFAKGELTLLKNTALAMVGSRKPTPYGCRIANDFGKELSSLGITIISGLAHGIDGTAHQAALDGPGKTIAVLGTGIDKSYPARHHALQEKIASEGLLISQFPLSSLPMAYHFPKRNELVSGLSQGTIVVEAALKSGSLITARLAAEQGKEVFAIPGPIHSPMSLGCHQLIKDGAKLTETVADILEEFNLSRPDLAKSQTNKSKKRLEKHLQNLVEFVGYEQTSIETLLACSGLSLEELLKDLLELELSGHITAVSGGYMRLLE